MRKRKPLGLATAPAFVVLIRAIHERGPSQAAAMAHPIETAPSDLAAIDLDSRTLVAGNQSNRPDQSGRSPAAISPVPFPISTESLADVVEATSTRTG